MYVTETQALTISEIVSREIDPVLFTQLLATDNSLKRSVSYAVHNVSASHPSRTNSGPPATPFPIGTGGGA